MPSELTRERRQGIGPMGPHPNTNAIHGLSNKMLTIFKASEHKAWERHDAEVLNVCTGFRGRGGKC